MGTARNGRIEIVYETFGSDSDPPLMLLHGLGSSMLVWHEDLCEGFVDRGFFVLRMDHRGSRAGALGALDVPALVVHGSIDTLIGPDAGRRTAELIPGAQYLEIEGMGHELPPQVWAPIISAVTALSARISW